MTCNFDGVTIVPKPYGQHGLPLHPSGGIVLGPPLKVLSPPIHTGGKRGQAPIEVGGNTADYSSIKMWAESILQGELCLVNLIMCLKTDGFWSNSVGDLTGKINLTLPYDVGDPAFVGGLAWFYPFGQAGYKRFVTLDGASKSKVKFVTYNDVAATHSSPMVWNANLTMLVLNMSYFVDPSSTNYYWG